MAHHNFESDGFELVIRLNWHISPADQIELRVRPKGSSDVYKLPPGNITDVPEPNLVKLMLRRIANEWTSTGWKFVGEDHNKQIVG